MITRNDAGALIPEERAKEVIKEVTHSSAVMRLGHRLPNLSRNQFRMPVLTGLAQAGFVNGDTGRKKVSKAEWDNVFMNVEEMAVIIPIPEAVLDDAEYDIFGEVQPQIVEAFGQLFDMASLFGYGKPVSWPDAVMTQAAAAGHTIDLATHLAADDDNDLFTATLGEDGVHALVEEDGYGVTGGIAPLRFKSKLRSLRDANNQPIFKALPREGIQGATMYDLDGSSLTFQENMSADEFGTEEDLALYIAGDWKRLKWAVRQDITYKILTEGVLQDNSGNITLNLAQQDSVALRAVMRLAWALPNPINRVNPDEGTRFPFAVLTEEAA